jgi:sugar/nucleoside kinase (ribokinase family)
MTVGPIVFVGHCVLEHVFDVHRLSASSGRSPSTGYHAQVGGLAGHAALAAQRLRHTSASPRVRLVSSVGDDESGALLMRVLHREGLTRQGVQVVAGARTGVSAVLIAAHAERQVHDVSGDALERGGPVDTALWRDAAAVQVDARWPEAARSVLEGCREHDVLTVLNADVAETEALQVLAPLADWVVFSVDGLRAWAGERHAIWQTLAKQAARQLSAAHLVVTLGAEGAWWHAPGGQAIALSAAPLHALDRNGSADVLRGALVLGLGEGRSADFALRWALAAAALSSTGQPLSREAVTGLLETPY